MPSFTGLFSRTVVAAVLLLAGAAGAAADDAGVWSRDPRFATQPAGLVPRATVFTGGGFTGGARLGSGSVATAYATPGSAAVPYVERRAVGGRIVTAPMTPQETRAFAAHMRDAGLSPYGAMPRMDPKYLPAVVPYSGPYSAGTIVIDTNERYLYLVQADGTARRYGVGVGRPGFQWAGAHTITSKREWPGWTPPDEMRERQPELPAYMEGGPDNPLGARAMYLGSSLYRIHGSNAPWTIGTEVSSGCIRMRNEDVTELYDLVKVGTKVIVI